MRTLELIKSKVAEPGACVSKISFIGYSLGGLINRWIVGRLEAEDFFETIQPINFVTLATPHLGSWRHPSSWTKRYFNNMVKISQICKTLPPILSTKL